MRRVLAWARPRRWSILTEAVLAALVAAIGVPVLALDGDTEPVDVVTAYLDALRDGDVDLAREYIREPDSTADSSWLTAEAMSSDWEFTVEQPTRSRTRVHAQITAGGQSAEAVFQLEVSEDEALITNPYAHLSMTPRGGGGGFGLSELELNGHAAEPTSSGESGVTEFALFPGAYTIGESNDLLSDPEPPVFLAVPNERTGLANSFDPVLAEALIGDDAVEERLNADLADWIDVCAQNADPSPAGCPFSAETDWGLTDGADDYLDPTDLAWEVDVYPRVRFATNPAYGGSYTVETVEPGRVHLTATAYDLFEDEEGPFSAYCAIDLAGLEPVLLPGGRFEFDYPEEVWADCRPA